MTTFLGIVGLVALVSVLWTVASQRRDARAVSRPRRPVWAREWPVSDARADERSLDLFRSVVNDDEWEMYRDLGFLCVTGRRRRPDGSEGLPRYRYLIYPHRPLVALLPRSLSPVGEYCVEFRDSATSREGHASFLPVGDDLIAKWMTVRSDENRMLAYANVASPGCQIPLREIERDVQRFARWRAERQHADRASALEVGVRYARQHSYGVHRVP